MAEFIHTLHHNGAIEIPDHLGEFAYTSAELLHRAHEGALLIPDASIKTSYSGEAHRVFIERKAPDSPYEYEFLAVHLGRTSLTVCLEHRHLKTDFSAAEHNRTSLLFENGHARSYASKVVSGVLEREDITENEDAGYTITRRLHHALGAIGVREPREDHSYPQAS